jgi:pimeloyl-ACP methyl ester carboxylesterase
MAMWDSQLNFLAERGYRAIAFDRRGFGRSDQPWNGTTTTPSPPTLTT